MSNGDTCHEEEGTWHDRNGTQVSSAQGRTSILPLCFPRGHRLTYLQGLEPVLLGIRLKASKWVSRLAEKSFSGPAGGRIATPSRPVCQLHPGLAAFLVGLWVLTVIIAQGSAGSHFSEFPSVWVLIPTELHPRRVRRKSKIGFLGMGWVRALPGGVYVPP